MSLRTLDLFSGAGGMSLGFEAAGMRAVGAVEANETASQTWQAMFGGEGVKIFGGSENGDVNNLPVPRLLDALSTLPDVVIGGPPCQGFSQIGRAKLRSLLGAQELVELGVRDPERNLLYRYFLAVVAAAKPKAFVMENVPGMRGLLGVDHAGRIAREAASLGYSVRYFLANAAEFGVPQQRWRLFFVGLRQDLGSFVLPLPPLRTHRANGNTPDSQGSPDDPWMVQASQMPMVANPTPAVTAWDALDDLPRLRAHLQAGRDADVLPKRRVHSDYAQLMRTWLPAPETVNDHWCRKTPRDFPIFAEMAEGDRYEEALRIANKRLVNEAAMLISKGHEVDASVMDHLRDRIVPPYRNDAFADKWRKLFIDQPSWTVTAHLSRDGYSHIHYDSSQARTITVREAARLQSFPDGFKFTGGHSEQFRQIGNAVPPLLAKAIGLRLKAQLEELENVKRAQAA